MRKLLHIITVFGMLMASQSSAFAKVNIFACSPEWASLAKEIGGDLVNIKSAINARQDIHYLRAKPSLLASMRKADLVFCTGASLEVGWLPILLKKAGGPDVQLETIGSIMASNYVERLEIMEDADRSMGHIHPEGNPHIHLNPDNIQIIAEVLTERLYLLDRDNIDTYNKNLMIFTEKWSEAIKRWNIDKTALKGKKVIVYHNSWAYMLKWLEIKDVAFLEPKPGIPPTSSHLKDLLDTIQEQEIDAIITTPSENKKAAEWLSEKSGVPIIHLPFTVGGNEKSVDLISLFDETFRLLKEKL